MSASGHPANSSAFRTVIFPRFCVSDKMTGTCSTLQGHGPKFNRPSASLLSLGPSLQACTLYRLSVTGEALNSARFMRKIRTILYSSTRVPVLQNSKRNIKVKCSIFVPHLVLELRAQSSALMSSFPTGAWASIVKTHHPSHVGSWL